MDKREKNVELLTNNIGLTNKTHIKVLSKYHELKIIRIVVFILSLLSVMTSPNPYVSTLAILYLILELFLYRYDKNLRKIYQLKRTKGILGTIKDS